MGKCVYSGQTLMFPLCQRAFINMHACFEHSISSIATCRCIMCGSDVVVVKKLSRCSVKKNQLFMSPGPLSNQSLLTKAGNRPWDTTVRIESVLKTYIVHVITFMYVLIIMFLLQCHICTLYINLHVRINLCLFVVSLAECCR